MAHYKLILQRKEGNVNAGFVNRVENGGYAWGIITDNEGNKLGAHCSTTLSWLKRDLLRKVKFDEKADTYETNW